MHQKPPATHHLLINLSFVLSKPTGISNYACNIFPYLRKLQPTLLVGKEYPNYKCYLTRTDLTPEDGTMGHFRRLLWTQWQLPNIYRKLKGSLLFSPVPEAPLYSDCRYIVMMHDVIPLRFANPKSPLYHYFRNYVPKVLHGALHVLCNSHATAQDIVDFYHIPHQKISPIHLGYDTGHFHPMALVKQSPYFLYIGRHDPYKNLHRLLDAFAQTPCDYQLWLAGSPDSRFTPKLHLHAQELGISERLKWLDYVSYDALPTLLNQALGLVFPSLWEGFGLPIIEAMACGTPVVTSNLSALAEVAGDAALLVNPYETQEIATALHHIIYDSQLRTHLSFAGIERASRFSWAKTGALTKEVLQRFS